MSTYHASHDSRVPAAIAAVVVQALAFWVLINGFVVSLPNILSRDLATFSVATDPPPPPPKPPVQHPVESKKAEGASAPPNLRSKATEVVAPPPVIRMPVPPPIVSAPIPALGLQASSGAATVAGPGTGAGGIGNGTGSGGSGNGEGAGGIAREAYQKSGHIKDSDFPKSVPMRFFGVVYVSFTVETDGRASGCTVRRSSGNGDIDATTCRLIEDRYRYEPARDAQGRKVRSRVENQDHTWDSRGGSDDDR